MRMPFGKYAHEKLEDLPSDYIEWVLENVEKLRPELEEELMNQLCLRRGHGVARP
jgi:uncharacterized protein (DUF3820 family)